MRLWGVRKMSSPYKDKKLLISSIDKFLNKHGVFLKNRGDKISGYFEMTCFNDVVSFYENTGFQVKPMNLKGSVYVYKLSPSGYPENFSYFLISKDREFEIHHSLSVESTIGNDLFYTPDIAVISKDAVEKRKTSSYYNEKRPHSFCNAQNLQTFVEVKHMNPFPELLFNFTGLLYSFMPVVMDGDQSGKGAEHIAPSLALSGNGNAHTTAIKNTFEAKYDCNLIYGLFYKYSQIYSKRHFKKKIFSKGSAQLNQQEGEG